MATQIIHINDVKRSFSLEDVYNDITDGIEINEKNEKPYYINAKIAISSNKPLRISGASAKDRIVEFELTNYYSENFSPEDEFNQWFFRDWSSDEWTAFDNFMLECARLYFENGIIEPSTINLEERKLINETNQDFVDFIDSKLEVEIKPVNKEFNKKDLHKDFLNEHTEYQNDNFVKKQRTFTRWLKAYARYRNFETDKNLIERKSGSERFFSFISKK